MAGRVQAQGHPAVVQALAVVEGLQVDVGAQAAAQDARAGAGGEVVAVAVAGVVAMAVGDHRTFNGRHGSM